jgi:Protein of unknown function (DUF1573)
MMKKIFSLIVFLALFGGFAFAQSDTQSETTDPTTGPEMTFETTEVDYGEIEQNSDPLRVFRFTNTGNEPLQIKNAKGSCGCTVPSWPKGPIFPGESGVIEVRYDTKRIGKFVKRVTLTTNEGEGEDGSKKVLTIKGLVNKKAEEPNGIPESAPSILTPNGQ